MSFGKANCISWSVLYMLGVHENNTITTYSTFVIDRANISAKNLTMAA